MKSQAKALVIGLILGAVSTTTITAIAANFQAVSATFPIFVNGAELKLEQPPVVIDGRTYLPLRTIGEALGVSVDWNSQLSRVEIASEKKVDTPANVNPASKGLKLGDTFEFDGFEITFGTKIEWDKVDNRFSDLNGKDVFKVPITVKNNKAETDSLSMFYYNLYGSKGTQITEPLTYFKDNINIAGEIRPGATQNAFMYFVYDGDGTYAIEFDNFKTKKEVTFNVTKN